jgi:flagellar motor switch protein FliM
MADEVPKPAGDFLDQSEIDRLLAQTAEQPAGKHLVLQPGGRRPGAEGADRKISNYDFRNPAFLSEIELRHLRVLHEDFIRYLSARLALFLRMEFGIRLAQLAAVSYAKFTLSLPRPTHVCLFKAEPLAGVGLMDINPRLALTIVDRLLGGRGHSVKAERHLTEIEIALLEDVLIIVAEEWCGQWRHEQEMHPLILGHENDGRFLQTSPKDAIMLVLTLDVSFGDCAEQMQIGVPYYTIEPIVKKMQARRQKDSAVAPAQKAAAWIGAYDRINMPVRAEWDAFEASLREITSLRVGDVIELPAPLLEQTRILLNGTPKFIGTVGLDGDRTAVQVTRKLPRLEAEIPTEHAHGRKNS